MFELNYWGWGLAVWPLVLFFFHFQRNIERAFLYGFDLCAMAAAGPGKALLPAAGLEPKWLRRCDDIMRKTTVLEVSLEASLMQSVSEHSFF